MAARGGEGRFAGAIYSVVGGDEFGAELEKLINGSLAFGGI